MVAMESALVSNESLGFLSFESGLVRHMRHQDSTLPRRMDDYVFAINTDGRGLWGTDPPKATADIMEAVLGAIHVHAGFEQSKEAALRILRPVLSLAKETSLFIQHPKTILQHLTGELMSVVVDTESEYCASQDELLWTGNKWRKAHQGRQQSVSRLQCGGVELPAVVGRSPNAATNHAYASVLAVLRSKPKLLNRFKAIRGKIQSDDNQEDGITACACNFCDECRASLAKKSKP
jgi:dsRNA-specific ribonuclease